MVFSLRYRTNEGKRVGANKSHTHRTAGQEGRGDSAQDYARRLNLLFCRWPCEFLKEINIKWKK